MSNEPQPFGVGLVLPYDVSDDEVPNRADAIAYLRAHVTHDVDGVWVIVNRTDPILLGACLAALAYELAAHSFDSPAFLDDVLLSWLRGEAERGR
jgi:hypothetical protein